jgi:hypothetical protein
MPPPRAQRNTHGLSPGPSRTYLGRRIAADKRRPAAGGTMNGTTQTQTIQPSAAEVTFFWFHRVIAIYCLLFGLLYWVRMVGIYEGTNWRFDLMPAHWQVASVCLAVMFPFAASGLWMVASWGPVIWLICAGAETIMYAGFPELFGARYVVVISHILVAVLYAGLRWTIHAQKRRTQV